LLEELMFPSVSVCLDQFPLVLAQQGGGAYAVGQVVGVIFIVLLVGAILWKMLKR
jgi:hypothetical protein